AWTGVQPVVERPTEAIPVQPVGPVGPGGPGGPPPGPPPSGEGKSNGPVIAIVVIVLLILGVGGFLLFGGKDDEVATNDTTTTTEDPDDTTTTTEEVEETTTTTEVEAPTTSAEEETTTTTTIEDPGEPGFTTVQDDTGLLVVQVPDTWTDVNGVALPDGSANLFAAPSIDQFTQFLGSGLSYTSLNGPQDPDAVIDFLINQNGLTEGCAVVGTREDYSDPVFTGRKQQFDGCGASNATVVELVAADATGRAVELTMVIIAPDTLDAVTQIENTFNFTS
ncbi:MAG: hypothetical protein H0W25_05145, partial [Acidimicrobiia bacterium]|nr:hypothetical protein [Acidimicrobiia bacterium]